MLRPPPLSLVAAHRGALLMGGRLNGGKAGPSAQPGSRGFRVISNEAGAAWDHAEYLPGLDDGARKDCRRAHGQGLHVGAKRR